MSSDEDDGHSSFESEQSDEDVKQSIRPTAVNENPFTIIREDMKPTPQLKTTQQLEADALVVRISEDNTFCAVGLANGDIRLFYLVSPAHELALHLRDSSDTLPCTDIRFFHKGIVSSINSNCILAAYASGHIRMWLCTQTHNKSSLVAKWSEASIEHVANSENPMSLNQILCLSVSYDNKRFVTGGKDARIRVYDTANTKNGRILQPSFMSHNVPGHTSQITALCYHPKAQFDPRYLSIFVSASWDDSIQIWNDQQGNSLWQIYGPHVVSNDGLDIDPIQNVIATCSWAQQKAFVEE